MSPDPGAARRPRGGRWLVPAIVALVIGLVDLPATAGAQLPSSGETATAAADRIQTAVPESPAFTYLGTSPAAITRPTTLKNLGAHLLQGVGADGQVRQGLAFEVTPAFYLSSIRLRDYQSDWDKYALSNLQLSFGTVRSTGDTASTDLALGVRLPFIDSGDPLRSAAFTDSVGASIIAAGCVPGNDSTGGPPVDFDPEANARCMAQAIDSLATSWAASHWNASALMLAAATGVQLEQSHLGDRRWSGMNIWLTGSLGLGQWGSLIVQSTYADNRRSAVDSLQYKALRFGSRLLVGGVRLNGFVEAESEFRWDRGRAVKKDDGQWSAGVEFRVSPELWLSTGFGEPYNVLDLPDRTAVFANLRWGLSSKARLDPS
jgi:hypothetical protein